MAAFQAHRSRAGIPPRLAVATLWVLAYGTRAEDAANLGLPPGRLLRPPPHPSWVQRRRVSIFRQGPQLADAPIAQGQALATPLVGTRTLACSAQPTENYSPCTYLKSKIHTPVSPSGGKVRMGVRLYVSVLVGRSTI